MSLHNLYAVLFRRLYINRAARVYTFYTTRNKLDVTNGVRCLLLVFVFFFPPYTDRRALSCCIIAPVGIPCNTATRVVVVFILFN